MKRLLRSIRRFAHQTPAQRVTLIRAVFLIVMVRAGTRVLGVARTQRWLARVRARPAGGQAAREIGARYDWAFGGLARRGLSSTCLTRALIVWAELRRAGFDAIIRLGVERNERTAHAWVEVAGEPITDPPDVIARYAVFK